MCVRVDGWRIAEWMDGWMQGWINGWMDAWVDICLHSSYGLNA